MKLNHELRIFALNPDKNIYGELTVLENTEFFNWYFGTKELIFQRFYSGGVAFRIMCKAQAK